MAFLIKSALLLSLLPFVATFLISLFATLASKRGFVNLSKFLTALAIAVGYAIGHKIATGSLEFIPKSVENWLPILALVASMLGLFENLPKIVSPVRLFLRLILGLIAIAVLLMPLAFLSAPAKLGWVIALGILLATLWTGLDELSEKRTDAVLPLSLSLIAAVNSAALFISHSAKLSQLSGVLASVVGAIFIFCLWQKGWSMAKGASGVFVSLLFGINVISMFYANLPLLSAIFLWLAPLSGWIRISPFNQKLHLWLQVALQIAVSLLLAFIGVGIAVFTHGLPSGGYY